MILNISHGLHLLETTSLELSPQEEDQSFEELQEFYEKWRDYAEYVVLQKQIDSLRVIGEVEKKTIAIKCSKRGNDVYWWRVDKRLRFLKMHI